MAALNHDLHKNYFEAMLMELGPIFAEIAYFIHNLPKLMKPTYANSSQGPPTYIHKQPLGVVLIFAAYNFPIQLALRPIIAAIAAGNAVCLKPSEISEQSEQYLSRLEHVFDATIFRVVRGDAGVCEQLLALKWDHIFFTGNSTVGRRVMTAAANHLTPVTLELGGKNPAIVTATADVHTAAASVLRARMVNCGQICIAAVRCVELFLACF